MNDKKLLKEFYVIADELDKNILRFNELEKLLETAKEKNDVELLKKLYVEYKEVSNKIIVLKEKSERLKEGN
jgi:hypothetical protein